MQIVEFTEGTLRFLDSIPDRAPARGFIWVHLEQQQLASHLPSLQEIAGQLGGSPLMDLHVKDLENAAHPSHYDYTSVYDLIGFRRLATPQEVDAELAGDAPSPPAAASASLASFRRIRTRAVGFAVFDRLLISVHPAGCQTPRGFIERYLAEAVQHNGLSTVARSRLPASPADLTLSMINVMVDGYLELRKQLAVELSAWQDRLLAPSRQPADWQALMLARRELHQLEDLCEEQSDAMLEWVDAIREQPPAHLSRHERDALVVRANDVVEHIRRVVHQVRRMEEGAEAAVQIHFSAQSHRTNTIMRTLTALTAVFLPLNLITGIFGMNFQQMPLLGSAGGFWWTTAAMAVLAVGLVSVLWRKRYLARTNR
jgi:magnesium transporter